MRARLFGLALAGLVGTVLLYLSRFWSWRLWPAGLPGPDPRGGQLGQWLRGTDFAPFELLLWAVGVFLVLSAAQRLFERFRPGG